MPELPEAETIARGLRGAMIRRKLGRVILRRMDIVRSDARTLPKMLIGRRVVDVGRRGKRVVIELDRELRLVFALGMTGRITIARIGESCPPHTHFRLAFGKGSLELRFCDPRRFGGIWLVNGHEAGGDAVPPPLGVEPLEMDIRTFRTILGRKRQIKALLLDQRVIAGLGNIYCDEALHRAAIHPWSRASDIPADRVTVLLRSIRNVLREAIRQGGSTLRDYRNAVGGTGFFQQRHRVYDREGQPCGKCKADIVRILAAGRSTHLCPVCQQAPP